MLNYYAAKLILRMPESIRKPLSGLIVNKYLHKYANIKIENINRLKQIKPPVIFVCNHLSNADGLILNSVLHKFNPYFVAGIKLNTNPISKIGLNAVNIIPIKPNSADIEALKKCIKKIKTGNSILIFPEGTRSRTRRLTEGKKGVVLIAQKGNVPIVPLSITGTEKLMPINDDDMANERFNFADVNVAIGVPFNLPSRTKEEDKEEYTYKCLNKIMNNIKELLPEIYK